MRHVAWVQSSRMDSVYCFSSSFTSRPNHRWVNMSGPRAASEEDLHTTLRAKKHAELSIYSIPSLSHMHVHTHAHTHTQAVSCPLTNTDSRRQDFAPSFSLALKYTWSTWTLCQRCSERWNHLSRLEQVDCGGPGPVTVHSHRIWTTVRSAEAPGRTSCAACWSDPS